MKYTFPIAVFLIWLLSATNHTYAQSDSTLYYNYTDTCISTSMNQYDRLLKHIIPDLKEVNQLYKVDLVRIAMWQPNFSYEKKISKYRSIELEAILGYDIYLFRSHQNSLFNYHLPSKNCTYHLALSSDIKHFHNIDNRIKKGKYTNAFTGNYFSTGITIRSALYNNDIWKINWRGDLTNGALYDNNYQKTMHSLGKMDHTQSIGYFSLGYGLQRRIGNVGFWATEVKVGIGSNKFFNTLYTAFEVNIKAGFAISSLKLRN